MSGAKNPMCKNTCTRVDGVHSTPGRGPTKTRMDRGWPSSHEKYVNVYPQGQTEKRTQVNAITL